MELNYLRVACNTGVERSIVTLFIIDIDARRPLTVTSRRRSHGGI